jgi:hypothetical protein
MYYNAAVDFCRGLNYAGHSDWRLPDKNALAKQYPLIRYYTGVKNEWYWSSTPGISPEFIVCVVCMNNGVELDIIGLNSSSFFVWPVRGGQDSADAKGTVGGYGLVRGGQ